MPSFLFTVDVPPVPDRSHGMTESPAWVQFEHEANSIGALAKAGKKLQKNVWLIPAENHLPTLVKLAELASSKQLAYSALLIPDGHVTLALDVKA